MTFEQWLNKFLQEKGLDLEESFEVEGPSGINLMTYRTVVDVMLLTSNKEKYQLKAMLVKIDYRGSDVKRYLRHLACALAI